MLPSILNARGHTGPNVWSDDAGNRYFVNYDGSWEAIVWKRTAGGTVTSFVLSTIPGNPLELPVSLTDDGPISPPESDEHRALAIGQDDDGYLYVAGNMHHHPMRMVKSTNPNDITAWTDVGGDFLVEVGDANTYPTFTRMSDGTLLFFVRRAEPSDIRDYNVWRKPPGGGWTNLGDLITGQMPPASPAVFPYCSKLTATDDVLRVVTTWYVLPNGDFSREDVGYMQSTDGGATWTNVLGAPVTLPLTYPNRAQQTIGINPGGQFNLCANVTADANGRPAFVIDNIFSQSYLVRWNGAAWTSTQVFGPASGRWEIVRLHGVLWGLNETGGRVFIRNLEVVGPRVQLGLPVEPEWEPNVDPRRLYVDDFVEILTISDRATGAAEVRSFGNGARSVPGGPAWGPFMATYESTY